MLNNKGRLPGQDKRPLNKTSHRINYPISSGFSQQITESWDSIFSRIGERVPRRGRARCPHHSGDSPLSLSVDENKGVFYCHVCQAGGDKITFIRKLYDCDFKTALTWFGLAPGELPKPNPEALRRNELRRSLESWTIRERRRIGNLIYSLNQIVVKAEERLEANPEDDLAQLALGIVYRHLTRLEATHDKLLSRNDADRLEVWRIIHPAPERRVA